MSSCEYKGVTVLVNKKDFNLIGKLKFHVKIFFFKRNIFIDVINKTN